ncbi:histone-lysine N-methyltransferase set-1-like [Pagrus major]|uniref:histone-lysine N-methyltransferase set-1-like n=1 Tax=Pagrus major TaxID=143350 RepID=UPI003CC8AA52
MAGNEAIMERSVRRRRVRPQQDAEQHIKLKTDKAGLTEHFINPYKGRGVLAVEVFNKGDFVLEYRGKLFKQDGLLTKNYNDTEAVFLFDFKWKGGCWCLDASVEDKSLGRLVNDDHIKPNCKIKTIDVGGMPHLCLFALRDIAPGEEITYNYGDSDWPWRRQQNMAPDVSEQLTPDVRDKPQQQLAPDVSQPSVDESDRHQQQLAPDVSQPSVDESDRPQQQLAPDVSQPSVDESDRHQQQLAPDVSQPSVDESDRPQVGASL